MEEKNADGQDPANLTRQSNVQWDNDSREGREKIEAHIENWISLLKDGKLVCPNLSCEIEFSYPKSLIDHLNSCSSNEGMQRRVLFRGTLPCVICGQEVLINQYVKHFRLSHKDINENLKRVHDDKSVTCLNHKCAKTFNDCFVYMQHCTKCKPAFLCADCQRVYTTYLGLQKHICLGKVKIKQEGNGEQSNEESCLSEKKDDTEDNEGPENAKSDQSSQQKLKDSMKSQESPQKNIDQTLPVKKRSLEKETGSSDGLMISERNGQKSDDKNKKAKKKNEAWVRRSIRGAINYGSLHDDFEKLFQQKIIPKQEMESAEIVSQILNRHTSSSASNNHEGSLDDRGKESAVGTGTEGNDLQSVYSQKNLIVLEKAANQLRRLKDNFSKKTSHGELETFPLPDSQRSYEATSKQPNQKEGFMESLSYDLNETGDGDLSGNVDDQFKHTRIEVKTGKGLSVNSDSNSTVINSPESKDDIFSRYFGNEKKSPRKQGKPRKYSKSPGPKHDNESSSDSGKKQNARNIMTDAYRSHLEGDGEKVVKKRGRPKKVSVSRPLMPVEAENQVFVVGPSNQQHGSFPQDFLSDSEVCLTGVKNREGFVRVVTDSGSEKDGSAYYCSDNDQFLKPARKVGRPRKNGTTKKSRKGDAVLGYVDSRVLDENRTGRASMILGDGFGFNTVSSATKKKAGRPKKVPVIKDNSPAAANTNLIKTETLESGPNLDSPDVERSPKKKVGRPRKASFSLIDASATSNTGVVKTEDHADGHNTQLSDVERSPKKKVSRPEKPSFSAIDASGQPTTSFVKTEEISDTDKSPKRKVGRPRKVPFPTESLSATSTPNISRSEAQIASSVLDMSDIGLGEEVRKRRRPKKVPESVVLEQNGSLNDTSVSRDEDIGRLSQELSGMEGFTKPVKKRRRPKKSQDSTNLSGDGTMFDSTAFTSGGYSSIELSDKEGSTKPVKKRRRPKKSQDSTNLTGDGTMFDSAALTSGGYSSIELSDKEGSTKPVRKRGRPKKTPDTANFVGDASLADSTAFTDSTAPLPSFDITGYSSHELSDMERPGKPVRKRRKPKKVPDISNMPGDVTLSQTTERMKSNFQRLDVSQVSDSSGYAKPENKRGRPKKRLVGNDAILSGVASQNRAFSKRGATAWQPKKLQKKQNQSVGRDSSLRLLFESKYRFSSKDSDTASSGEARRSRSLSDSETARPSFALPRVRRFSDSECYSRLKKTKKNKTSGANINTVASKPRIIPKVEHSAFLGKTPRRRGRPSKAELLLRKQAEQAAIFAQASGIEADFVTPQKKKPGRKKKTNQNEESSGSSEKKPRFKRIRKPSIEDDNEVQLSMLCDVELKDRVENWSNSFDTGIFKCPAEYCDQEFITWISLFCHLPVCKSNDQICSLIYHQRTLSCHVCKQQIEIGSAFSKHFVRYHKDAYDLTRGLELDGSSICFNCDCNQTLTVYNDCAKHGTECGSLMKCDICQRKYKARNYFHIHRNKCENEMKEKSLKSSSSFDPFEIIGPRKSAKRAIGAISKLDLSLDDNESIASTSSKRSKLTDEDFDQTSVISEEVIDDLEEEEEEDDDDDDDEEDDVKASETENGERKINHLNKLMSKPAFKSAQGSPNDLVSRTSKKALKISTIKGLSMRPKQPDIMLLKKWKDANYSNDLFPEWMPGEDTISVVSESEKASYLPRSEKSPVIKIIYETRAGNKCCTEGTQIPCFKSMPGLKKSETATLYVGGPVQALEWCPVVTGCSEQFIAISSHLDYNEVHTALEIEHNKGLIQIWKMSKTEEKRGYDAPSFAFGIVHDFGPVYSIKWCPSSCQKVDESLSMKRLGVLAVACSDGLVRILSIPFPEDIISFSKRQQEIGNSEDQLLVRIKPSLTLAASRVDAESACGLCKCMCLEWLPTKGHSKIAAGFGDGSICIWNLDCESDILSFVSKDKSFKARLPFTRIYAYNFDVRCLNWCSSDDRYIASGSFEKSIKVFDITSPDSPVIVLKKAVLENLFFPLQKTGVMLTEEECFNNIPSGLRFIDLLSFTEKQIQYQRSELITSHNAGCKGFAFSEWLDVAATSCLAGELMVKSCSGLVRSQRLPVYRIASEPNIIEPQSLGTLNETKENGSMYEQPSVIGGPHSEDETQDALDIIKSKTMKFQDAIFNQKYTFRDNNFFEFRERALHSAEEFQRVRNNASLQSSNVQEHETRSVNKLQWNPNYGSHHMLISGGTLGIVRIHFFSDWLEQQQ